MRLTYAAAPMLLLGTLLSPCLAEAGTVTKCLFSKTADWSLTLNPDKYDSGTVNVHPIVVSKTFTLDYSGPDDIELDKYCDVRGQSPGTVTVGGPMQYIVQDLFINNSVHGVGSGLIAVDGKDYFFGPLTTAGLRNSQTKRAMVGPMQAGDSFLIEGSLYATYDAPQREHLATFQHRFIFDPRIINGRTSGTWRLYELQIVETPLPATGTLMASLCAGTFILARCRRRRDQATRP